MGLGMRGVDEGSREKDKDISSIGMAASAGCQRGLVILTCSHGSGLVLPPQGRRSSLHYENLAIVSQIRLYLVGHP